MNDVLGLAVLVLLVMMITIMGLVLMAIWKIKSMFTRALTFAFTFSFKPRWKKL